MAVLRFRLAIDAEQMLAIYQGQANRIYVVTEQGTSLSLPAGSFRRFTEHRGLYGRFEIEIDENGKCLRLDRLSF